MLNATQPGSAAGWGTPEVVLHARCLCSQSEAFSLPCRGEVPLKMSAGHFCCVYEDELWVFPGPGNVAMRRIHCLNLQTYR